MGKRKLIDTNKYLKDPETRKKMFWINAYTSARIEGVSKKDLEIVRNKLINSSKELDPKYKKIINDNLWDLI